MSGYPWTRCMFGTQVLEHFLTTLLIDTTKGSPSHGISLNPYEFLPELPSSP